MTKTNYTIERKGESYVAKKDGEIETQTISEEAALHFIWKNEGGKPEEWYYANEGQVFVGTRYEQSGITAIKTEVYGMISVEVDAFPGATIFMSDEEADAFIESVFERIVA